MPNCNIATLVLIPVPVEISQEGRVQSVTLPTTDDVEAAQKATLYVALATRGSFVDVYGPFFSESSAKEKATELQVSLPFDNVTVQPIKKS